MQGESEVAASRRRTGVSEGIHKVLLSALLSGNLQEGWQPFY